MDWRERRGSYPEVLPDDHPDNQEYIAAYNDGESQSCYQLPSQNGNYDETSCESDCQNRHSQCDSDMENSFVSRAVYKSSRPSHEFGMWFFNSVWVVRDTYAEGERFFIEAGQTVKKSFERLYDRMSKLSSAYIDWLREREMNSKTEGPITPKELWDQLLLIYNQTDPGLVDNVYESLDLPKFGNLVKATNASLSSYDFGPGEWTIANKSNKIDLSFLVFFISSLVLCIVF